MSEKLIPLSINGEGADKTIIISHGFLSHKGKPLLAGLAKGLSNNDFRVVRFNFNTELISERVSVLRGVINQLVSSSSVIGLVGVSLGGLTSLLVSGEPLVKSLALINPVYDVEKTFNNYIKHHRVLSSLITDEMKQELLSVDLKSITKTLTKPTLVISGERDRVTNPSLMRELYNDLNGLKAFHSISGCGHSVWRRKHIREVKNKIIDWFKRTLI